MTKYDLHKDLLKKALLSAGLIGISAFFAMWAWTDTLTDLGGDSAGYLIMSRLYSPYHAPSIATLGFKSQIIFPPLFPWILALVDGGYHFLIAHLVVVAFASASVAVLYLWLREDGMGVFSSALIALVFAILPATVTALFNIWSEFPYIFFSLAALTATVRAESSPLHSARFWYLVACLVACATLIRVASLPLLGAFLVYLSVKRPPRWAIIAALTCVPFLVWAFYSNHNESGAGGYVAHVFNVYSGDALKKLLVQLRLEYRAVYDAWQLGWIGFSYSDTLRHIVDSFWLICICGWFYRLKSLKFDAIYVLLYVILLFLWPHSGEAARYSLVIYPVFIANGFRLIATLARYVPAKAIQQPALKLSVAIMLICALPATALNIKRFQEDVPDDIAYARHTEDWYADIQFGKQEYADFTARLLADLKKTGYLVPQDDCIFAIKPSVVILYSDRMSYGPPLAAESDAKFDLQIKKCRFAYVMPFSSPSYNTLFYPLDRLGERSQIVSKLVNDAGAMQSELIEIRN